MRKDDKLRILWPRSAYLIFGLFGFFFQLEQCFFSHNNSTRTVFSASFSQNSASRTGPIMLEQKFCHYFEFKAEHATQVESSNYIQKNKCGSQVRQRWNTLLCVRCTRKCATTQSSIFLKIEINSFTHAATPVFGVPKSVPLLNVVIASSTQSPWSIGLSDCNILFFSKSNNRFDACFTC